MRIAICDDEVSMVQILEEKIKKLLPDAVIDKYLSGDELIASGSKPDILFLDIQMPGMDGMETAKVLRQDNENMILIFVTAAEEYVFQAFDVGAFHYLVKPFSDEKFKEVVTKAVHNIKRSSRLEKDEKYIMVQTAGSHIKIFLRDIVYADFIIATVSSDGSIPVLQVFVQVLEPLVQEGAVLYPVTIAFSESFQRAPPGFVPVQVAVDFLIPVKNGKRAFQQRHRVQHEVVVPASQPQHHPREIIDKALEKIAGIRTVAYQRYVLRRQAALEETGAQFIPAAEISETDGEIPLPVQGIPDLFTIRQRHIAANATLLQIAEQNTVVQRPEADIRQTFLFSGIFLAALFREKNRLPFRSQPAPCPCDESRLLHEVRTAGKLTGKGKNITSFSGSEVVPDILADVHLKRGSPFLTVRGEIPTFIPTLPFRIMPQPCQKFRDGDSPYIFYIHKLYCFNE